MSVPTVVPAKQRLAQYIDTVAEDADKAWPLIVKMARVAKVPVEIELEYHEPSPHAGRVIKLWYDPVSDQQGRGWLDN